MDKRYPEKNNSDTYSFIFASDSLNLTIASSCLTVIGIAAASPVSFACRLISYIFFIIRESEFIFRSMFMLLDQHLNEI